MSNIFKNGWPIPRFDLALNFTDIQWLIGEINQARNSEVEKFENKVFTNERMGKLHNKSLTVGN